MNINNPKKAQNLIRTARHRFKTQRERLAFSRETLRMYEANFSAALLAFSTKPGTKSVRCLCSLFGQKRGGRCARARCVEAVSLPFDAYFRVPGMIACISACFPDKPTKWAFQRRAAQLSSGIELELPRFSGEAGRVDRFAVLAKFASLDGVSM
jgi:hypothetical protein